MVLQRGDRLDPVDFSLVAQHDVVDFAGLVGGEVGRLRGGVEELGRDALQVGLVWAPVRGTRFEDDVAVDRPFPEPEGSVAHVGLRSGRPGRPVFLEQVGGGHPAVVEQLRRVGRRLGRSESDRVLVQRFDAQGIQGHAAGHDLAPVLDGPVVPFEIEPGLRIGPAKERSLVVIGRDGPAVAEDQVTLQMENPRVAVFGHLPVRRRGGEQVEVPVDPGQRLVGQGEAEDLLVRGRGPVHEPVVQLEGAQVLVFRRCGVRWKGDAHGVDVDRFILVGRVIAGVDALLDGVGALLYGIRLSPDRVGALLYGVGTLPDRVDALLDGVDALLDGVGTHGLFLAGWAGDGINPRRLFLVIWLALGSTQQGSAHKRHRTSQQRRQGEDAPFFYVQWHRHRRVIGRTSPRGCCRETPPPSSAGQRTPRSAGIPCRETPLLLSRNDFAVTGR